MPISMEQDHLARAEEQDYLARAEHAKEKAQTVKSANARATWLRVEELYREMAAQARERSKTR